MSEQLIDRASRGAVGTWNTSKAPKLAVNLIVTPEGAFDVRSCEVIGDGYRNRTSFQKTAVIDEVFVDVVASALGACLRDLSLKTEVVSLPDFLIEAPGLTLAGAHILVSEHEGGQVSIIIRFKVFFGGFDALLNRNYGFLPGSEDLVDRLASEVLFDITLPILNICSAADLDQLQDQRSLIDFLGKLVANTNELNFRSTLLRRFLEGASQKRINELDRAQGETRMRGLLEEY